MLQKLGHDYVEGLETLIPRFINEIYYQVLNWPWHIEDFDLKYRKISNIRRTKSQNLTDSPLVLRSSLSNPLKPGIKSRMKM